MVQVGVTLMVQVDRAEWIALHGNDDGFDCYDMDDTNTLDMLDYRYFSPIARIKCAVGITASVLLTSLHLHWCSVCALCAESVIRLKAT